MHAASAACCCCAANVPPRAHASTQPGSWQRLSHSSTSCWQVSEPSPEAPPFGPVGGIRHAAEVTHAAASNALMTRG